MSSGHGSGPDDPQGKPTPADASSKGDQDEEWTAWRQGPAGYSRPLPPEPEPGSASAKPGSHEKPAPRHPYTDRVPGQPSAPAPQPPAPSRRRDDLPSPRHSAEPESRAYQAPSPYEEPGIQQVPKPRPYVGTGSYEPPSRRDQPGPGGTDAPGFDEPGRFDESFDNRPDDVDSGPRSQDEKEGYAAFWNEGRGGGAHASPSGSARTPVPPSPVPPAPVPSSPVPPPPGDTSIYRNPPPKRQLGFLVGVAAVIVAAAVAVTLLLTQHGSTHHPAASGSSGSASPGSAGPHTPAAAPTPPSVTGASGHLGVPGAIGSLRLNSGLTSKFVGSSARKQDASSFAIQGSDVVSGFYTASPTAATFATRDPRLMFLAAYLSGSGNAHNALHAFMTNHTFTSQQQVSAGPKGGVAACGLLPEQHAAPVAHCMWADGDTYADFYAWNSSTSALAKTMITIRPKVELGHS